MKTNIHFYHIALISSQKKKCFRNTVTTFFTLYNIFFKFVPFLRYVVKHCTAEEVTDENIAHAHCILDTYGFKYIPEYVIHIAVRATMVARTLLNATSYVVYIACLV